MKPTKDRLLIAGDVYCRNSGGEWYFHGLNKAGTEWIELPTTGIEKDMLDRIAELEAEVEELREKKT